MAPLALSWSVIFATAFASPTIQSAPFEIGQKVQTTSGTVLGHASSWQPQVSEYLGIPYAIPPLGPLRFAAPKPFKPNSTATVFTASKHANDCMQYAKAGSSTMGTAGLAAYGAGMGGGTKENPHFFSEDCLGINVWTKPQSGEKAKAVLMWIYGGGFSTGNANAPFYNGARLAEEEDVVVVSFNYRINIFGFPRAPGLPDQNVALLDQRLAVEWARDNIANFGGDPKRITLFGESAGGFSVDYYAYAWTKDPIVNGFIPQSGTAGMGAATGTTRSNPNSDWFSISAALGCGGAEAGEKTVECMRTKSADDIMDMIGKKTGGIMTPFGPMADGKLVYADTAARGQAGNFIKRPILVGNTDNELGITKAIPGSLGPLAPPPGAASNAMTSLGTAMAFTCPAADAASNRVKNGVKAWRYRYMGIWPNTAIEPDMGSYHSSEIPLVFGATELKPGNVKDLAEEAKLSQIMRHAWAEFAKDPENGLSKLGWPVYDDKKATLIRLGYNNMSEPNFGMPSEYDGPCNVMAGLSSLGGGLSSLLGGGGAAPKGADAPQGTIGGRGSG